MASREQSMTKDEFTALAVDLKKRNREYSALMRQTRTFARDTILKLAKNYYVKRCKRHPRCRGETSPAEFEGDVAVNCGTSRMPFDRFLRDHSEGTHDADYKNAWRPLLVWEVLSLMTDPKCGGQNGIKVGIVAGQSYIDWDTNSALRTLLAPYENKEWYWVAEWCCEHTK
jgi:hypothetical protein